MFCWHENYSITFTTIKDELAVPWEILMVI